MTPITFQVLGDPAPGGSKTVFFPKKNGRLQFKNGDPYYILADAGKYNAKWKKAVAASATAHMQLNYLDPFASGIPLKFRMTFYKVRPQSHYGTGKNADTLNAHGLSLPYPTMNPDTTKLIRSTEDALKGICWHDDNQVVSQSAHKRWGSTAGVRITIEAMAVESQLFQQGEVAA